MQNELRPLCLTPGEPAQTFHLPALLIHLGFVLKGRQIQGFVPAVAGIMAGVGEAGPAMLWCQPGRAIPVPDLRQDISL